MILKRSNIQTYSVHLTPLHPTPRTELAERQAKELLGKVDACLNCKDMDIMYNEFEAFALGVAKDITRNELKSNLVQNAISE